jgi:hypothetical protein
MTACCATRPPLSRSRTGERADNQNDSLGLCLDDSDQDNDDDDETVGGGCFAGSRSRQRGGVPREDVLVAGGSRNDTVEATLAAVAAHTTVTTTHHNNNNNHKLPPPVCVVNNNTGLVHEASAAHYDTANPKYHKEKPSRVNSVLEALAQDRILQQCQSLESPTVSDDDAVQFLEDEDYLRVHLPGYMQR